jgi:hypothetical protein
MTSKRERTELVDVVVLLREQLKETLQLGAHVQYAEAKFRERDTGVLDLLRSIALELWTLSERIERRATTCGSARPSLIDTKAEPFLQPCEDGSLESLLNRFCTYARNTSARLAAARQGNDRETVLLLDRILSMANASIWFLDVYSNAVWLRCRLSPLPKWKPVSVPRQIAS